MTRQTLTVIFAVLVELLSLFGLIAILFPLRFLDPRTTLFAYAIFGFTVIVIFNVLDSMGIARATSVAILLALGFLTTWFPHESLLGTLKDVLWFILLSAMTYLVWRVTRRETISKSRIAPLLVWIAAFLIVNIVMAMLSIFTSHPYRTDEGITTFGYLGLRSFVGIVLGAGIGIGREVFAVLFGDNRWTTLFSDRSQWSVEATAKRISFLAVMGALFSNFILTRFFILPQDIRTLLLAIFLTISTGSYALSWDIAVNRGKETTLSSKILGIAANIATPIFLMAILYALFILLIRLFS